MKHVKAKQHTPSDLWCLARLGARQLFHGPNNLVVAPTTADRWIGALTATEGSAETIAQIAQSTGDTARDVSPSTLELARQAISKHKDADSPHCPPRSTEPPATWPPSAASTAKTSPPALSSKTDSCRMGLRPVIITPCQIFPTQKILRRIQPTAIAVG